MAFEKKTLNHHNKTYIYAHDLVIRKIFMFSTQQVIKSCNISIESYLYVLNKKFINIETSS